MVLTVEKEDENPVDFADVFDPQRWGIPKRPAKKIREAFEEFCLNFYPCFATATCNNAHYAWDYIKGLIAMTADRNFANIARKAHGLLCPSDGLHHFMSNSPWSPRPAYDQIQRQIADDADFNGGILTLDESGDERNSENCAGASHQYCGRYGKKEMVQNAVCLGYYSPLHGIWAMLSGVLYMAEKWFSDDYADQRKKVGIPEDREFQSKPKLALEEVKKALANGVRCEAVVGDSNYGRDGGLRKSLGDLGQTYVLDTSTDAVVYLEKPKFVKPREEWTARGDGYFYPKTVDGQKPIKVRDVMKATGSVFKTLQVRNIERGVLENDFHARRVWVLIKGGILLEEWLLIRRQKGGKITYSLSNAPADTPLEQLARWRVYRYFVERTFQDAKSDLGWDELEARKYRSWDHHTALTALALWFIASLKLDWKRTCPADPALAGMFGVNVLPALSTKNVREHFRQAFETPPPTEQETRQSNQQKLMNRTKSTASRVKKLKNRKKHHADYG